MSTCGVRQYGELSSAGTVRHYGEALPTVRVRHVGATGVTYGLQ